MGKHGLGKFLCSTCNMKFSDKSYMEKHKRDKHGFDYIQCKYCERKFASEAGLNPHIALHERINSGKENKFIEYLNTQSSELHVINDDNSKLIPLSGIYGNKRFALVTKSKYNNVMKHKWSVNKQRNKVYSVRTTIKNKQITLSNFVMGKPENDFKAPKGMIYDHKSRNRFDNRDSNLDEIPIEENMSNRSKHCNNTSGLINVRKEGNRFYAQFRHQKVTMFKTGLFCRYYGGAWYNDQAKKWRKNPGELNKYPNKEELTFENTSPNCTFRCTDDCIKRET
jgi:Zinc-finger of C2H2 type